VWSRIRAVSLRFMLFFFNEGALDVYISFYIWILKSRIYLNGVDLLKSTAITASDVCSLSKPRPMTRDTTCYSLCYTVMRVVTGVKKFSFFFFNFSLLIYYLLTCGGIIQHAMNCLTVYIAKLPYNGSLVLR
jgi:hypothetical protein